MGPTNDRRSLRLRLARLIAAALTGASLAGCVSADLQTIAPQPDPTPMLSMTPEIEEAFEVSAQTFADNPAKPVATPEMLALAAAAAQTAGRPEAEAENAAPETPVDVAAAPAVVPPPGVQPAAGAATNAAQPLAVAAYIAPPPLPPLSQGAPVDALIAKYASHYGLPESFVRKVVRRESNFNPRAHNRGHWGLMQIKHATARGMGYRGSAEGLLDPETNLIYSVKYLRGAYMVAQGDEAKADRLYQTGYYYHAKRMGLLDETGLGRDRARRRGAGS